MSARKTVTFLFVCAALPVAIFIDHWRIDQRYNKEQRLSQIIIINWGVDICCP